MKTVHICRWIIIRKKTGFVGKNLGQGKNDYGDGGIFHVLFLEAKRILCYKIYKYGTFSEKKTFEGYHDSEILLETYNYFELKVGETVNGELPRP